MSNEPIYGVFRGRVTDNNDPQNQGRIRALVPGILGTQRSNWCVPLVRSLTKPKINDQVFVQFLDGDVAYPVYSQPQVVFRDMQDIRDDLNTHTQSPHA